MMTTAHVTELLATLNKFWQLLSVAHHGEAIMHCEEGDSFPDLVAEIVAWASDKDQLTDCGKSLHVVINYAHELVVLTMM